MAPGREGDRLQKLRSICLNLDQALARIENTLIVALSLLALGLGVMQVILRYVFNTGFEWNEALFVLTTITAMLAAGIRAVREDRHISVDIVHEWIPSRISVVLRHLAALSALALCVYLSWCGWQYVGFAKMMGTASPETGFKDWAVYSIMPTALALFSLRYVLRFFIGVKRSGEVLE